MRHIKSIITTILYFSLLILICYLAIIYNSPLMFFILGIGLIVIARILINLEFKKINSELTKYYNDNDYDKGIEVMEKKYGYLFFIPTNRYCLINIVIFNILSDNLDNAFKYLNKYPSIKRNPYLYYVQYLLAVALHNEKDMKMYSNKLLNKKNKYFHFQKDSIRKINEMLISKKINKDIYENTKYPLLKRICLRVEDDSIEVINNNIVPIKEEKEIDNKLVNRVKILLNILTIVSFFIVIIILGSSVSKNDNISIEGIYYLSIKLWILYLLLPISITNLLFGLYLKRNNLKYESNIGIGILFTILILGFSSFFIINKIMFSDDKEILYNIEDSLNVNFPDEFTIVREDWTGGSQTTSDDCYLISISVVRFENNVSINSLWKNEISGYDVLPTLFLVESRDFDYFLIYCYDDSTFNPNVYRSFNSYICFAYRQEDKCMIIYEFSIK